MNLNKSEYKRLSYLSLFMPIPHNYYTRSSISGSWCNFSITLAVLSFCTTQIAFRLMVRTTAAADPEEKKNILPW